MATSDLPSASTGPMRGHLLVSDVDDTLLGDDAALAEFARWYESARDWLSLAYASGRFAGSVATSIRESGLPPPVAIIGGVGTEILLHPLDEPVPLKDWPTRQATRWSAERVRQALSGPSLLRSQPEESQSRFKLSYFLEHASSRQLAAIRQRLRHADVDADLIYSSERDLDVLPRGVNKGSAAEVLADHLGIPHEAVLVSGNSANDASLFRSPFRGIVVGNAHDELKALAGNRAYLAQGRFARGVLEGIRHWLQPAEPEQGKEAE